MSDRTCEGQVALVTGASQGGTGTAIAVRLAAEGAKVAVTARSANGLEETRRRVDAIGGDCLVLPADLSDPAGSRSELVARAEAELGPIDILVNNAAVNGYVQFEEATAEALERCLQVNLWAPWELMKAVVPGMRERGRGWVLNLTSFAAELPPGPPFPKNKPAKAGFQYGASKAALALCSGDPAVLTGRIAYSLQLLLELKRPVFDLHGEHLVDGWQPDDLRLVIARQEANLAEQGWRDAYSFGRVHSPRP